MKLSERVSTDTVAIAIIIAIALCVRIVSFEYLSSLAAGNPAANPYPIVAGDSVHYAHWADNLLALHAYQDTPSVPLRAAPPGYPALLAAMQAATGSKAGIVIVQTLLSALALVLMYKMARTLVPPYFAMIPALVYAIDPMVVFTDTAILTDGLFSALLVALVYLAFFQTRLSGLRRAAGVGLLLGALIMMRPIGEFLVLVFPALYLMREWIRAEHAYRSRLKEACVLFIACALVVAPWMVRNEIFFGSFEISPLGGHDLLTYDVRGFLAWRALAQSPHPVPAILVLRHADDPITAVVEKKIAADLAAITPPGGDTQSYEGQLAVRYIMRDPIRYAYFHTVNTLPFFLSSSIASYGQIVGQLRDNKDFYAPTSLFILGAAEHILHPENVAAFGSALWSLAPTALELLWWTLVILAAIAAVVLRRRDFTVLLCAVLVLYFAGLTGPLSGSRYRIPAEPYLLILASVGVYAVVNRKPSAAPYTSTRN